MKSNNENSPNEYPEGCAGILEELGKNISESAMLMRNLDESLEKHSEIFDSFPVKVEANIDLLLGMELQPPTYLVFDDEDGEWGLFLTSETDSPEGTQVKRVPLSDAECYARVSAARHMPELYAAYKKALDNHTTNTLIGIEVLSA